jgi:photosystem II stability/assembly factor-like uncharacterized protein
VVDPVDRQHIWAGLEVDGVRHSKDGGKTWEVVTSGVTDPDIHNLAITVGPPKTLLIITPREIFSSTDNGVTWEPVQARSRVSIPYCRGVLVKADDPQVIYLGNGESAFGGLGALHRSRDRGQTWETLPLPLAPNGTIRNLATHAADLDFLLASSVNGEGLLQHRCGRFLEQVCQEIWRGARPHLGAELALGHSARGRTPRLHPRASAASA